MQDETFDEIYSNIDKMEEMKRYRAPTPGYFPSVAEINTFVNSDHPHMIPFLMWLDNNLKPEDRAKHKDAINRLNQIIAELD